MTGGADRQRGGAALAEFAVVSILLWLLLAGILELGRALAAQQVLQNAASASARALSLRALPAALAFPGARDVIFDEGFLVADASDLARCGPDPSLSLPAVRAYMEQQGAPALNQLLLPLWIRDVVDGAEVLRYPGTVLYRSSATGSCADGSVYTVRIPELLPSGGVAWRDVVEPLPMDSATDPFPLAAGGWASLRVLYPFQSVGFQGWQAGPHGGQTMIDAADPAAAPPLGTTFVSTSTTGAYGGLLGLGVLHSMGREVRPYRRVLAANAAFRREVFVP
ncbi:MAG: TadE/TadG family type IV pilus assembly protein [Myxococcota bacterium]